VIGIGAILGSAVVKKIGGALWKDRRRKKITGVIVALVVLLLGKVGIGPDIAGMVGEIVAELILEAPAQ
jgi:hypothetical protein